MIEMQLFKAIHFKVWMKTKEKKVYEVIIHKLRKLQSFYLNSYKI
jgi:hypothetical protein